MNARFSTARPGDEHFCSDLDRASSRKLATEDTARESVIDVVQHKLITVVDLKPSAKTQ